MAERIGSHLDLDEWELVEEVTHSLAAPLEDRQASCVLVRVYAHRVRIEYGSEWV
jgi:hypothetical protein